MLSRMLFLLFFVLNTCAYAADKIRIVPEPGWLYKLQPDLTKKPPPKGISNGYYMELVDHQVNLVNNTEYTHFIRHIVNETGVQQAAEVSVTFSPLFEQVVFHKITLTRNGIVVSELNAGQIKVVQEETDASDFQYNGLKRAFLSLKDVRKDDRIEASYSITGFNPVFGNRYDDKIYFSNSTAITNYYQTIIAPAARKFYIQSFNHAPQPVEETQGNLHIYHWDNPPVGVWQSQPGVPSWFDNYPYIAISEFNGWPDVVKWGLDVFNHYKYPLSAPLKSKMAEWRKEAKGDKDTYASLAIRFVQDQVRYLGLEMGTYTHQPHSPSEVFQHRFGDCKDKALLLAMLLREEQIEAYVALTNTGSGEKLALANPSAGEFNHAIVAIKRSLEYSFIDPTISWQRGGLINLYVPAYGYALVLQEGGDKLQAVEPGVSYSSEIEEKLDLSSKDSNSLNVVTTYKGGMADEVRRNLAEMSAKELEENYLQYYVKTFNGIQLTDPITTADDSLKNEITVKELYSMPSLWHVNEKGRASVEVFAKPIYEDIPDPSTVLKDAPVAINYPLDKYYTLRVIMPTAWTFNFASLQIKNKSYQFDFIPEVKGAVITLNYHLKTFRDNIPTEALAQYRTDYKKIEGLLDFDLYEKGKTGNKPEETTNGFPDLNINGNMIWFALLLIVLLIFLFRNINQRSAYVQYAAESGWPVGGWLVVLSISLALAILVEATTLMTNNFFSASVWKILGDDGGPALQYVLAVEMAFTVIWLCGSVAMLYWLLGRRDIFPLTFIWYMGSIIVGLFVLAVLYSVVKYPSSYGNLRYQVMLRLLRSCVYGAVWITYILRADRVKCTFLQPYK